jgi:hypothetical protein
VPPGAGTLSHGGLRWRNGRPSCSSDPPGRVRERVTWTRSATGVLGVPMDFNLATHELRPKLEFSGLDLERLALVDLAEDARGRVHERAHVLLGAELARQRGPPA